MPISTAEVRAIQGGALAGQTLDSPVDGQTRVPISTRFNIPYSYEALFESGAGINPEEFLAAAHAGCFTVALTLVLRGMGHPPTDLSTAARVHEEPQDGGFAITLIELDCQGAVPGIDEAEFRRALEAAKAACPVSKALTNVEIAFADVHLRATV